MSNRLKSAGTFRGYRRRGRIRCPVTERDKYGGKIMCDKDALKRNMRSFFK